MLQITALSGSDGKVQALHLTRRIAITAGSVRIK